MERPFLGIFDWPVGLSTDPANIFMFVIAMLALLVSINQIRQDSRRERTLGRVERELARVTSAKHVYMDYLRISFDHPDLSIGVIKADDRADMERYDTYVSLMLWSLDELLSAEEGWSTTAKYQISLHKEYIATILSKDLPPDDSFREGYGKRILKIVDEVLSERSVARSTQDSADV